MIRKPVAVSMLFLAVSTTLMISGGIALMNAGVVADENNLVDNFHPSLWSIFGVGLIGLLISLPCFLGTIANTRRPNRTH